MRKLRSNLSFANVMSVVAVFIALGGVGYAAVRLPRNSVGTRQIKPNAVKGSKVADGSLSGADIGGAVAAAGHAANADNAAHAMNADHATNADSLDNLDSPAFGAGILTGQMRGLTTIPGLNERGAPSGLSDATNGGTDLAIVMWTPNVPILASDLAVRLSSAPGAGATRTFFIQGGNGQTSVSCPISGSQTTCNSGAASEVLPAAGVLEFGETTSSPTAPAPADAWFGWRARPAP